jgi:hypothetical protein
LQVLAGCIVSLISVLKKKHPPWHSSSSIMAEIHHIPNNFIPKRINQVVPSHLDVF